MQPDAQKRMEKFYSEMDGFLQYLWADGTRMIHFGFYPAERKISHAESLIETVRQVAIRLQPASGQKFLDAGCGVGGAAGDSEDGRSRPAGRLSGTGAGTGG